VENDEEVARLGTAVVSNEEMAPATLDLPEEASFDDFVAAALERNPGIRRAMRTVQVLGYRVPQVTSLEDPIISVLPPTGDMTQTAAGMMDGSIGISQMLPFPSKLWARGRIAENEVRMAFAALADVRIATVTQVAQAYYDYDLAQVSIDITRESQRLLQQIRDVASARYRAGVAMQQDVLRAEVELYSLTNDLITFEQQRATARAKLNTLMDRSVEAELPPPKPFELEAVDWKLPQALDRAVDSNPQLARLREQVHRDLEAVKLARLGYYPDLRLGFSYTFIGSGISPVANGDDNWSIPLGLTLPIWWQRLRAKVLEANAQTLASIEQFGDVRNMVLFGVQDTLVKIDTQYRRAILYRDLIVPRAQLAVEVSMASYRAGQLEFAGLIDNWRNWLNAALAYHRALAQLEQRFADLQQIVGVRIPRRASAADAEGPAGDAVVDEPRFDDRQGQ
jgi:outer membrane protein TolC